MVAREKTATGICSAIWYEAAETCCEVAIGPKLQPTAQAAAVKLWGYSDSTEAPWCDKQMPRLGFVNPILNWFPAEEVDRAGSRTGRQNLERFDR